jgi:hypothetical protein
LNICFFNILAQLIHLSLSLLVHFYLGRSGSAGFVKTLPKLFNFTRKIRTLAFSLGTGLAFGFKLLL